jgi:hypothetical protein
LKNEYFSEFEKEFKNISGCEFGDYMGPIHGKNQRSKISCYCPFKEEEDYAIAGSIFNIIFKVVRERRNTSPS